MVGETLEGALATLKRLDEKHITELNKRFQEPELFHMAGLRNPPQLKDLRADLIDGDLWVWEIIPEGQDKSVGYAGLVTYSGPPFVFVYFFDHKIELEIARDAVLQIVMGFFTETEEDALWFYVPRPVSDEIRDLLVEGGFDPYEDDVLPGVDLAREAAFRMERHTFVAYYGEESGESYETNDDDDDPRELEF